MAGYRVGYIALSNEGEFSKEAYQQMLKVGFINYPRTHSTFCIS
jgi:hypothetical protein